MQCWEALHPKKGATVPATPFCNVELRMRNLIAEAADGEPVLLGVVGLVHAGVVGGQVLVRCLVATGRNRGPEDGDEAHVNERRTTAGASRRGIGAGLGSDNQDVELVLLRLNHAAQTVKLLLERAGKDIELLLYRSRNGLGLRGKIALGHSILRIRGVAHILQLAVAGGVAFDRHIGKGLGLGVTRDVARVVGERAHICRNGRSVGQIIVIAAGGHWGEGTLESILGCIGQLGVNNICDAVGYAVTQGRFLNAVLQIGYIRLQIGHIGLQIHHIRLQIGDHRAVAGQIALVVEGRLVNIMVVRQIRADTIANIRFVLDVRVRGGIRLRIVALHILSRIRRNGVRLQIVGNHVQVHAVGVVGVCRMPGQCGTVRIESVRHRRERHLQGGKRSVGKGNRCLDTRVVPLDAVPTGIGLAGTYHHREQTVIIGLRCLCLRVNGRGFRAVEDIHDHFDSLVGHQLVLGVAHHGLVADFVVLCEDCCHAA